MATSKSNRKKKKEKKWIAGAFVFSGRPDPTWSIDKKLVNELENVWNSLKDISDKFSSPSPPILGYRGCFIREYDTDHGWFVYKSTVTLQINGSSETRSDRQQKFETLLLSSAPPGILPDHCPKYEKV